MTPEPTIPIIILLIVVLPTVVLLAGSIVALLVTKNKVIRTVAAVVLVSFAILVVGGMLLVPAFTVSRKFAQEVPTSSYPAFAEASWDSSTEEALQASIYSSAESAARALAQSCLEFHQAVLSEQPAAIKIYVGPQANQHSPALGVRLASFLSEQFPHSKISESTGPPPTPRPSEELCISVELVQVGISPEAPWDSSSQHTQGQVKLKGTYQDGDYQDLRRFVEKPWVDHFDDFISQRPGRRLLRANSAQLEINEREADGSAREHAAMLIAPIIERSHGIPRGPALDLAVQSAIDDDQVVIDRFSQKLISESAGEVWRTTLLIDARPDTLAKIIHEPSSIVRKYEYRRRSAWIGLCIVLALTVFLYFVLDELTRGYFVWNLRVTALLTMLTLAVVFCWLMIAVT